MQSKVSHKSSAKTKIYNAYTGPIFQDYFIFFIIKH